MGVIERAIEGAIGKRRRVKGVLMRLKSSLPFPPPRQMKIIFI
jgi:hypothetical protein